ncbi:MAG: hypothetical protein PHH43_00745 [Candidatus Cloacimonetes bacterium]|nr:hypothetical protein [Candidatus Cloacimonadota bacterium]
MSEIFIHKTRGEVVECIHRGDALVVNHRGSCLRFTEIRINIGVCDEI